MSILGWPVEYFGDRDAHLFLVLWSARLGDHLGEIIVKLKISESDRAELFCSVVLELIASSIIRN